MSNCKSLTDYLGLLGNNEGLMLVVFCAQWSIPSTVLCQDLQQLVEEYEIKHVVIDFNDCPDVFQRYKVNILPCVKLIRDADLLGEVRGNSLEAVRQMIDKHIQRSI